jgi:alginate O-acetyltransferase complex protein AlgI
MLFNSFSFALFLALVFLIYWALQKKPLIYQNLFLLLASYFFYAWWDYRFLLLLILNSLINYWLGIKIEREERLRRRKLFLILGVIVNIGTLCVFKYLGFFASSFGNLLNLFGLRADFPTLNIILPLGISYYTFQTLGYLIDVYRKQFPATRDVVAFLLFVAFFPKLVAGPIERAPNLLPQIQTRRSFEMERAKDGLRQILWGLFKKIVIADNLSVYVADIYHNYASLDGVTLIIGTLFFAIQIYCDFSGYSDMALGAARLFGFELMQNFAYPYFSRDIAEFWRRWHISLSTWFRDYVFFPLGWLRRGKLIGIRNVLITFTLSGLWHGADWTFATWGLLNGIYFVPQILAQGKRRPAPKGSRAKSDDSFTKLRKMLATFAIVCFAWIFFRADSLGHASHFISRIFTHPWGGASRAQYLPLLAASLPLFVVEWFQRKRPHGLDIARLPFLLRWAIYYILILAIFWYGSTGDVPFIYFKF